MADVIVMQPAPEPHHPDCAQGCSAGGRWLAGPCQHQCAKTPEFQEQCERDADASRLRFRRSLGIGALREVPPAAGVAMGDCGNAECNWRGPISECSHIGTVGPCCPQCREIVEPDAPGVRSCDPSDDSALLDHIQRTGSTVELLPGDRFRIGGLHAAVSTDLRAAIRIAAGTHGVKEVPRG